MIDWKLIAKSPFVKPEFGFIALAIASVCGGIFGIEYAFFIFAIYALALAWIMANILLGLIDSNQAVIDLCGDLYDDYNKCAKSIDELAQLDFEHIHQSVIAYYAECCAGIDNCVIKYISNDGEAIIYVGDSTRLVKLGSLGEISDVNELHVLMDAAKNRWLNDESDYNIPNT